MPQPGRGETAPCLAEDEEEDEPSSAWEEELGGAEPPVGEGHCWPDSPLDGHNSSHFSAQEQFCFGKSCLAQLPAQKEKKPKQHKPTLNLHSYNIELPLRC